MRKVLIPILLLLNLFSCEPRSEKDYVKLVIPNELKSNEEAVEELQEDAEQLNRIFNSIDDLMEDLLSFQEEIEKLDSNVTVADIRVKVNEKVETFHKTEAKIALNIFWLGGKKIFKDSTIYKNLSQGQHMHYKKCSDHIKIQKDLIKEKVSDFSTRLNEFFAVIEEKEKLLETIQPTNTTDN